MLEGETCDQRLAITRSRSPGRYATWEPYRQTIETTEGVLVAERRDPAASFAGLTRQSPWDEFQVAYFAGEATWNYFTAPFILARSDFTTEETKPWHEDGQTWRSLPRSTSLTSPSAEPGNRSKRCALTSHRAGPFPTTS